MSTLVEKRSPRRQATKPDAHQVLRRGELLPIDHDSGPLVGIEVIRQGVGVFFDEAHCAQVLCQIIFSSFSGGERTPLTIADVIEPIETGPEQPVFTALEFTHLCVCLPHSHLCSPYLLIDGLLPSLSGRRSRDENGACRDVTAM